MLRRSLRDLAPLLALWIAVGAYYVFIVSAGDSPPWHAWSGYYDQQAAAFRAGHLALLERPSHALMALKNPYDVANITHWRWDYVYYRGHLYFYFGLVPAFIAAAVKVALRGAIVGDNALTFAFFLVRLVAGTLLIRAVARRAVPQPPPWAVWLAMVVFALANPTPFTLARGAVYEAAISGGVAFMMVGILFGYWSLHARDRGTLGLLAAASLCFGLAGGSRLSLIPTGTALAALTGFWSWRRWRVAEKPRLPAISPAALALAALAPAGAVTGVLLIINHIRFGAWTEFGRSYVMTFPQLFLSPRFLLPDSYAYAFAPPRLSCVFPYVTAPWDAVRVSAPAWLPLNWPVDLYVAEPTLGLLVAAPFTWLALAAPVLAIARWRLRRATDPASAVIWITPRTWLPTALAVCLAGAAPLLILNMTTMRYEHDFASALFLLAIFGGWRLLAAPASRAGRRAAAWLFGLLAAATIVAGVLLGFTGYFSHFERNNPPLLHRLQRHLDLCGKRAGR